MFVSRYTVSLNENVNRTGHISAAKEKARPNHSRLRVPILNLPLLLVCFNRAICNVYLPYSMYYLLYS